MPKSEYSTAIGFCDFKFKMLFRTINNPDFLMFMVGGGGSWLEDAADYKLTNGFVLDLNVK